MLSDLNLRPDSESSCHSAYLRPPFDTIFRFWFFDLPLHFQNFLIARAAWVLQIQHFRPHFWYQDCLEQRKIIGPSWFMKKVVLMTHPNEQELNWWHRDEATLTTNCCYTKQVRWWVLTDCCDHKISKREDSNYVEVDSGHSHMCRFRPPPRSGVVTIFWLGGSPARVPQPTCPPTHISPQISATLFWKAEKFIF